MHSDPFTFNTCHLVVDLFWMDETKCFLFSQYSIANTKWKRQNLKCLITHFNTLWNIDFIEVTVSSLYKCPHLDLSNLFHSFWQIQCCQTRWKAYVNRSLHRYPVGLKAGLWLSPSKTVRDFCWDFLSAVLAVFFQCCVVAESWTQS